MTGPLVVEQHIGAQPDTVFSFFTTSERWLLWQGTEAQIDARPGGVFRVNVQGDGFVSGHFVEVEPPRRLVFTWGWEGSDYPVPPGSSTVEIDLEPIDRGTLVRLTHRGLPSDAMIELHGLGWRAMLPRLATAAETADGR